MVNVVVDEAVAIVVGDAVVVNHVLHKVVIAIIKNMSCRYISQRMWVVHLVDEVAAACR